MTQTSKKCKPPLFARLLMILFCRGGNGAALVGDADEEFPLVCEELGVTGARRWYRRQVFLTLYPVNLRQLIWSLIMLKNDLKLTVRNMIQNRLYSVINLAGLALGLAAFIIITLFIIHETGYDRVHVKLDRLYRLGIRYNFNGNWTELSLSPPGYGPVLTKEFPEVIDFVRIAAAPPVTVQFGDQVYTESFDYADPGFFRLFDFPLIQGDVSRVLKIKNRGVLSKRMAEKYFGQDDPMGKTLILDGEHEIVVEGVFENIPTQSHIQTDLLISMVTKGQGQLDNFTASNYFTYLELTPGSDTAELEKKVQQVINLRAGADAARLKPVIFPMKDIYLHSTARYGMGTTGSIRMVRLFSVIAAFVLIMACVNFINLSTARSSRRSKEIAVRKVLGSHRLNLIRRFLGESLLMVLISLAAALVLVHTGLPYFNHAARVDLSLTEGLSQGLVPILAAITLIVGVLAGAYPAFLMSGFMPASVLRGRSHTEGGQSRLRQVLVIFQFGISIALVFGSLTIARQTRYMKHRYPGFEKENVISIRLSTSRIKERIWTLKEKLLLEPSIISASVASRQMGSVASGWGITTPDGTEHSVTGLFTDEDYVKTLKMRIATGRDFDDEHLTDRSGFLINESAARLLGGSEAALGQQLSMSDVITGPVIGVVENFNFKSLHMAPEPLIMCWFPGDYHIHYLTVRLAAGQTEEAIGTITRLWKEFEPDQEMRYEFLDDHLNSLYRQEERISTIVMNFTGFSILIGALGLFGLAVYAAERRRKEIAIRKVMGAGVGKIVSTLCREFIVLIGFAVLWAWPVTWLLMRQWLQQFAYRISPSVVTFIASAITALLAAVLSVGGQALRTALSNPVEALKDE